MNSILNNFKNRFKHGRIIEGLLWRFGNIGFILVPYIWYEEALEYVDLQKLRPIDHGYEFTFFEKNEMDFIGSCGAYHYEKNQLLNWLKENKKCFGVKKNSEIAAFTWFDLDECKCNYRRFNLKHNEAYLFDMFTMKSFRGKGLAPYLRYKGYEALKAIGREKCYSYSDYFNTPARKFKQKLNAKPIELGLYINLYNKYRNNIILKKL